MAGQRAGVPADEAEGHADVPGPRRAPAERIADRRPGDGRQRESRRAPQAAAPGRARERRAASRPPSRRSPGAARARKAFGADHRSGPAAATLALGLPLVGALFDELLGSGPGWLLAVLTVLGTAGAAFLSTPAGWWWVVPAPPPVVLVTTAASQLLADSSKYQDGGALATEAVRWAIHGFPVMAWAIAAALAVVLARVTLESGGRRG
ncbi:hypothetical protein P3T36_006106 [Kitasatospora sp. MAP12-15]|uniref:DUF6542 domain-containing protein n=1 Tax=unclassified Kitasatospora TaxID=2633591 RepID=UPI0024764275|nr:DUF6542 domain-containing protein [Kitasatospora sp. MAP12-44]MDH6112997.1 hypothetical protein [Kitasatospora sp. MAP12-44]